MSRFDLRRRRRRARSAATVGARLVRDGHSVLFCDADPEHVAAINEQGLAIEGPVEAVHRSQAPAVTPDELPDRLGAVLLAVKSQHTAAALEAIVPRLAPDGFVVSLQNGVNEPLIASIVGEERTVGAFVNFGADYLAPGRIFLGGRGALYVGELDGRPSERVERLLARPPRREGDRATSSASSGRRRRTARCCSPPPSPTSRSSTRSPSRATAASSSQLAREVLAAAPVPVEPFDGFDADDLDGSVDRLVEFNRRSAKTHSGIYRDLMVRKRTTEKAMLADIDGPLLAAHARADRGDRGGAAHLRGREPRAAGRLPAPAGAGARAERRRSPSCRPVARAATGPLHGVAVAVKDNIDVAGVVTTNASTVGVPPPAARDAPVVTRLRDAGADLLCKTNLLEYAAGSVNPAYGMTFNPRDPSRTAGGSSSGSAALVAAGVVRLRARHRHRRLDPHPGRLLRHRRAEADATGSCRSTACSRSRRACDHVGTLTRTVAQTATLPRGAGRPARSSCARSTGCASACCGASSTTRT